ncbi:MAG: MauE/DoxX family redox-associated membrane protein [candidate division KSB1 bacterium]|nr:MauE/DoxX family redox-associated membrane protein [candidate division KSB1 bacterium]
MKSETMKWFVLALRWIVALLFIYSGFIKIMNPAAFAEQVDNYRLVPYFLVTLTAAILPWLELFCGLLLIFGRWLHGALLILVVLNLVFLFAVSSALAQGLDISCGCFSTGNEGTRIGIKKLIENVMLVLVSIALYLQVVFKSQDRLINN